MLGREALLLEPRRLGQHPAGVLLRLLRLGGPAHDGLDETDRGMSRRGLTAEEAGDRRGPLAALPLGQLIGEPLAGHLVLLAVAVAGHRDDDALLELEPPGRQAGGDVLPGLEGHGAGPHPLVAAGAVLEAGLPPRLLPVDDEGLRLLDDAGRVDADGLMDLLLLERLDRLLEADRGLHDALGLSHLGLMGLLALALEGLEEEVQLVADVADGLLVLVEPVGQDGGRRGLLLGLLLDGSVGLETLSRRSGDVGVAVAAHDALHSVYTCSNLATH